MFRCLFIGGISILSPRQPVYIAVLYFNVSGSTSLELRRREMQTSSICFQFVLFIDNAMFSVGNEAFCIDSVKFEGYLLMSSRNHVFIESV